VAALTLSSPAHGSVFIAEAALSAGEGTGCAGRTVTNGSETVTGTINFEAFGQTAGATGSSSSPYMYAGAWGYRTDGDAGLMHVGARYYDAQVGRFITRDTVLSEHPYLYCEHDPVNWVDPGGHLAWWEVLIDWLGERGDGLVRILPGGSASVFLRGCLIEVVIGVTAIIVVWRLVRHWNEINPPGSWGGNPDDRHSGGTIPSQVGTTAPPRSPEKMRPTRTSGVSGEFIPRELGEETARRHRSTLATGHRRATMRAARTLGLLAAITAVAGAWLVAGTVRENRSRDAAVQRDVRAYLGSWIAGDYHGMYALLSSRTQSMMPYNTFIKRAAFSAINLEKPLEVRSVLVIRSNRHEARVRYVLLTRVTARRAAGLLRGATEAHAGLRTVTSERLFVYERRRWRMYIRPVKVMPGSESARSPRAAAG